MKDTIRKNKKQPHEKTPAHNSWMNIRARCNNPNNPRYYRYGGRGVKVSPRWNNFENFLADMGEKPPTKDSIDRIDNDGDYSPENCRWATHKEQCNNRSSCRMITIGEETLSLTQWCEKLGVLRCTAIQRLSRGWTENSALGLSPRELVNSNK